MTTPQHATQLKKAPTKASKTHAGVGGKDNQDSHGFFRSGPGDHNDWDFAADQSLFVAAVADGVTGQTAGAQASQLAIQGLGRALQQQPPTATATQQTVTQQLEAAIHAANGAILAVSEQNPDYAGMSTTLVVAVVQDWQLYVAHLGDSRAYLIRNNTIHRLTLDHSWIQEAIDAGRYSEAEAKQHSNRHTILRHLSGQRTLQIDHTLIEPGTDDNAATRHLLPSLPLAPGDVILLCSDGLTEKVTDDEILAIVRQHRYQPKQAARHLVRAAVDQAETDNITVALLTMPESSPRARLAAKGFDTPALALAGSLLTLLIVIGMWLLLANSAGGVESASVATLPEEVTTQATGSPSAATNQLPTPLRNSANNGSVETRMADVTMNLGTAAETARGILSISTPPSATPGPPAIGAETLAETAAAPPTATLISTPTTLPINTPTPATPTAISTAVSLVNDGSATECVTCTVTLVEPLTEVIMGKQTFSWTANPPLDTSRFKFELIFWEDGQDALTQGFGPTSPVDQASAFVDLDAADENEKELPQLRPGTMYHWGVRLVDTKNTNLRIKFLGDDHLFEFQRATSGGGSSDSDASPAECPNRNPAGNCIN